VEITLPFWEAAQELAKIILDFKIIDNQDSSGIFIEKSHQSGSWRPQHRQHARAGVRPVLNYCG
jgi:hypothetical protein